MSGGFICKFEPIKTLGSGTFGYVDAFFRKTPSNSTVVAIKRPKFPQMKLLTEAKFQESLHNNLIPFGLEKCVPKVIDIFRYLQTGDIWFTMSAYEPNLLSEWCIRVLKGDNKIILLLLLQIALILEVFETELKIDHRDLKINNMIIVEEPYTIEITWNGVERVLVFPFYIVIVDFGFACSSHVDVKRDGLPPLDACPKEGRDLFQVLVSLWNIKNLREHLSPSIAKWICDRITKIVPIVPCIRLAESSRDLDWMYSLTDDKNFRAPLCAPRKIIQDCLAALE